MERLYRCTEYIWFIQCTTVHQCGKRNKRSLLPFSKLEEHEISSHSSHALSTLPVGCHFQVRVEAGTSLMILNLEFRCISHHSKACCMVHQSHTLWLGSPEWYLVKSTKLWSLPIYCQYNKPNKSFIIKINFPIKALTNLWDSRDDDYDTHSYPHSVCFSKPLEDLIG